MKLKAVFLISFFLIHPMRPVLAQNADMALKEALSFLPEKKLTLDFFMRLAVKKSSSFGALEAGRFSSEATAYESEIPYDWTLTGKYELFDDQRQKVTPFEPSRIERDYWNLGIRKYFSTGTQFETNYGRADNKLKFPPASGVSFAPYYEDGLSFSLRQNLWSDFLGKASKASLEYGRMKSESEKYQYDESIENWALELATTYYTAWLTQNQYYAAQENYNRQQKLLQSTQAKLRRGTAERPDVLQVESAALLAQNSLSEAEANLNEVWKRLVVILKLPESWHVINPEKIPMILNAVPVEAQTVCKEPVEIEKTNSVLRTKKAFEAAEKGQIKATSEDSPKLQLYGNYTTNGVSATTTSAQKETLDGSNPAWTLGIELEIPLEFSAGKAAKSRAQAEYFRARAQYDQAVDDKKIELASLCERFQKSQSELENSRQAFQNQSQRLILEGQRFQVGRTNTFSVIQAGDDKTRAEQNKNQSEVNYRLNAWKVLKAASELEPFIANWKN